MKKTLAIVLALVMVLAMIPAMSAASEYKIAGDTYNLEIKTIKGGELKTKLGSAKADDAITAEYKYDSVESEDLTDMWAENAKMAGLVVKGWHDEFTVVTAAPTRTTSAGTEAGIKLAEGFKMKDVDMTKWNMASTKFMEQYSVSVDGDAIEVGSAEYKGALGVKWEMSLLTSAPKDGKVTVTGIQYTPYVVVPVQLTKAGYQDSLKIALKKADSKDNVVLETANIAVTMKNTDSYKADKTATITDIRADAGETLSAYIVGDKIYLDFVKKAYDAVIKVAFADENGAPFSVITYAYDTIADTSWDGVYTTKEATDANAISVVDNTAKVTDKDAYALSSSVAKYTVTGNEVIRTKFVLETQAADYYTKDYAIVVRENIKEDDPKGIYFAETTKTIAMGKDIYTPVVMGVKTGKPVAATLNVGTKTDKEVVDIINNGTSVIGTREGVAYITAEYTTDLGAGKKYTASSMKIIVTLPGESIPEVEAEPTLYYVTCRALNVRAGAGTSFKKVDLLKRGEAVKVVSVANGWAKLADGTFVCEKYIAK